MVMQKPAFFTRHAFLMLLAAIFLLPIAMRGARIALENNKNDVKAWLPAGFEETRELDWFRGHFLGEQFVVISWPGCTLDDPRVEQLAQALVPPDTAIDKDRPQHDFFKSVITGPQVLEQMTDPGGSLKLKRSEALRRLQGSLVGPDGKTTCLIATLTESAQDNLRKGLGNSWPLTRILMGREDGLLFKIAAETCDLDKSEIRIGGPPVDNVAIDDEGEITLMRLVGLSGLVGLCISYYCFRSKRVTLMVFCCGLYGAAASLMIVYVTGGLMDAGAAHFTLPCLCAGTLWGDPYRQLLSGRGSGTWSGGSARACPPCGLGALHAGCHYDGPRFGITRDERSHTDSKIRHLLSVRGAVYTRRPVYPCYPRCCNFGHPVSGRRNPRNIIRQRQHVGRSCCCDLAMSVSRRHALITVLCTLVLLILGAGLFRIKNNRAVDETL